MFLPHSNNSNIIMIYIAEEFRVNKTNMMINQRRLRSRSNLMICMMLHRISQTRMTRMMIGRAVLLLLSAGVCCWLLMLLLWLLRCPELCSGVSSTTSTTINNTSNLTPTPGLSLVNIMKNILPFNSSGWSLQIQHCFKILDSIFILYMLVAVILTSFGWWENFTEKDSWTSLGKFLWRVKQEMYTKTIKMKKASNRNPHTMGSIRQGRFTLAFDC